MYSILFTVYSTLRIVYSLTVEWRIRMGIRHWRVNGNFRAVGDVVVLVQAPNLTGAIRKGALAIKGLPELKGKRLKAGSFTIVEVEAPALAEVVTNAQLPLPGGQEPQGGGGQTPPSIAE